MKLVVDLPVKYTAAEDVGHMTFVLASFLSKNVDSNWIAEEYFNNICKAQSRGMQVIMDNGAWEFGKSMDVAEYMKVIQLVHPDYAIIPDVMRDSTHTLQMADDFMEMYYRLNLNGAFMGKTRLYFAPQGETYKEVHECYNSFMRRWAPQVYGVAIPKHIGKWMDRIELTSRLWHDASYRFQHVHILGLNGSYEFAQSKVKRGNWDIDSIDTKHPMKDQMKNSRTMTQLEYYLTNEYVDMEDVVAASNRLHAELMYQFKDLNLGRS